MNSQNFLNHIVWQYAFIFTDKSTTKKMKKSFFLYEFEADKMHS